MHCSNYEIVFQEVPGEIAICFTITGCKVKCEGCHSPFLWKAGLGNELTKEMYNQVLEKYEGYASCILFMGGEWHQNELIDYLFYAKKKGFKTCLYTGEEKISNEILPHLTWLKTGKWNFELGGLDSPNSNQRFVNVKTNELLNHLFIKDN